MATDGAVVPLPPGVTETPGAGEAELQPRVAPRPPPDDSDRWNRLNELMAVPGAQTGDDDEPDDDDSDDADADDTGDGDESDPLSGSWYDPDDDRGDDADTGDSEDDEGGESDPMSGSWYDPEKNNDEGFIMPVPDDDVPRPTFDERLNAYLDRYAPETLRTPCDECELIAQETRARISEYRAAQDRVSDAGRERIERGDVLSEAESLVRHLRGRLRHYDSALQQLRNDLDWEKSKVRNDERVEEVEREIRRQERLRTDIAAELVDAEAALREAQQAFDEAHETQNGFARRRDRLHDEVAALLMELFECEREKCDFIRNIDFEDEDAPPVEGDPDDADAAREVGRILDEAREDAPEGSDD